MASPLGKLTAVLGLDAREFTSGISSAQKTIGGFGVSTKTAMGIVGGAAALGFGAMTKGALESEKVQGAFQAATGRSAEEAKAFAKEMNALVGTNNTVGKSFEEIAEIGTKVTQQFGLTGAAGAKLTDQFAGFAKVTGQDAASAVDNFDAALDAFGEPAERAASLMDQLVVSNQKYGTDAGPAALSALQGMAPALSAMGLGLDEGVGLLNLFESAGLDAAGAQKALNAAVKNLPPGENINDVITRLAGIEDPAQRAQAAIDIFGAKAGVGIANAIKPGMTSLDEFIPTIEETAGASDKASDQMVTTSDKIRQAFDKIGAAVRGFGQELGPAITGLASLGSAFGSFLSTDLGGKLIDSFKGVWGKVAASAPVKFAVGAAGAAAGAVYAVASAAAEKLVGAISGVWSKVGSSSAVKAAATAAGTSAGGAMGLAATAAFGLVLADLATKLPQFGEDARDTFDAIGRKDIPAAQDAFQSFIDLLKSNPFTQPSSIVSQWGLDSVGAEAGSTVAESFGNSLNEDMGPAMMAAARAAGSTVPAEEVGEKVAANFVSGFGQGVDDGLASMPIAPFSETRVYAAMLADARALGEGVPGEIGQGMQSEAHQLISGADALRDILENGLSPDSLATEAMGRDYIKLIRQGMDSEKFGAVETAQQVAIAAIDAIENAGKGTEGKGLKRIGQLYVELLNSGMTAMQARAALAAGGVAGATIDGLEGKYPALVTTGETMANKVRNGFTSKPWSTWGWNAGDAWIDGVKQALRDGDQSLQNTLRNVVGPMIAYSPPRVGPLREIDKWGLNIGETWLGSVVTGIATGAGKVRTSLGSVAAALGATLGTPRGGLALATARVASLGVNAPGLAMAGGSIVVNINGPVYGGPAGLDQLTSDIANRLRLKSRTGSRL